MPPTMTTGAVSEEVPYGEEARPEASTSQEAPSLHPQRKAGGHVEAPVGRLTALEDLNYVRRPGKNP